MIEYTTTGKGEFVAVAPVSELPELLPGDSPEICVHTRAGQAKTERVRDYGQPFDRGGIRCRYAYLVGHGPGEASTRRGPAARQRKHRQACVTDGNCSSFGDGRSCGGYDCDGW
jgi:hypothetical protein